MISGSARCSLDTPPPASIAVGGLHIRKHANGTSAISVQRVIFRLRLAGEHSVVVTSLTMLSHTTVTAAAAEVLGETTERAALVRM